MSRMGQFVFECQEIAESNYNESRDVVIAEVERAFFRDKTLIPMLVRLRTKPKIMVIMSNTMAE